MQTDLHQFLSRLAGTVALALLPVLAMAFVSMPSSLHHHVGKVAVDHDAAYTHMT